MIKRIDRLEIGTNDEIEQEELEAAIAYILKKDLFTDARSLMTIAYFFGKMAGVREERRRKKTLSEEKI